MIESSEGVSNPDTNRTTEAPKAIVHKKILDTAQSNPDASIEAIAELVSGANPTLVEQVLGEYGDPATESATTVDPGQTDEQGSNSEQRQGSTADTQQRADPDGGATPEETPEADQQTNVPPTDASGDSDPAPNNPAMSEGEYHAVPDPSQLTEKQLRTLRVIADRPEATQSAIADELEVTSSTISQRVNAIDGFDWSNRHEIVQSLFATGDMNSHDQDDDGIEAAERNGNSRPTAEETVATAASSSPDDRQTDLCERIDTLSSQLDAIEQRLADRSESAQPLSTDAALVHKIVHACIDSEKVSEDEELQIIESMLRGE